MDELKKLATHVEDLLDAEIELVPSSKLEIEKLRARLPVFPESLASYLAIFCGDSRLLHPFWLMGAKGILASYEILLSLNPGEYPTFIFEEPFPFRFDKFWREKWIPIAELNNEDFFFIDMDPGEGGVIGQIGLVQELELCLVADSLENWFSGVREKIVPPLEGENEWEDQIWYEW